MKKTIWTIVGIIIVIAIVMFAIEANKKPTSTAATKEPIKIGAVLSLTGFAAPWGEYAKNGINLAVKKINDQGGINGRPVQVTIEDDQTDGKNAVTAYDKLQSVDGVQGIIGGVFDFTAQPLIPLASSTQMAFISPSNFRIAGGFDLNSQSFVMLTDFNQTILKLQPYLASSSIKKLAVVHYQSTFGGEISKTLDGVMKGLGRGGIIDTPYPQIGNADWKTTIIKLKSTGVDAVFLDMVGNDPLVFLQQAKELGFTPVVMSYNGIIDAFVSQSDKSLLDNVVILNWEVTSSKFADMYKTAYGIPPTKSADKYFDSVYVMANAIANSSNTSKVASYIESNSFTTPNSIVSFGKDHAVSTIDVAIQIYKNGVLTPWTGK